jgi:hypothetical protein
LIDSKIQKFKSPNFKHGDNASPKTTIGTKVKYYHRIHRHKTPETMNEDERVVVHRLLVATTIELATGTGEEKRSGGIDHNGGSFIVFEPLPKAQQPSSNTAQRAKHKQVNLQASPDPSSWAMVKGSKAKAKRSTILL